MCVYLCMCVSAQVCVCASVYVCMCMCVWMSLYVWMCVCVHVWMCACVNNNTRKHTQKCTYNPFPPLPPLPRPHTLPGIHKRSGYQQIGPVASPTSLSPGSSNTRSHTPHHHPQDPTTTNTGTPHMHARCLPPPTHQTFGRACPLLPSPVMCCVSLPPPSLPAHSPRPQPAQHFATAAPRHHVCGLCLPPR